MIFIEIPKFKQFNYRLNLEKLIRNVSKRSYVILDDLTIECHGGGCSNKADTCGKNDCDENAYCEDRFKLSLS